MARLSAAGPANYLGPVASLLEYSLRLNLIRVEFLGVVGQQFRTPWPKQRETREGILDKGTVFGIRGHQL